jgi:hypothetical protein
MGPRITTDYCSYKIPHIISEDVLVSTAVFGERFGQQIDYSSILE